MEVIITVNEVRILDDVGRENHEQMLFIFYQLTWLQPNHFKLSVRTASLSSEVYQGFTQIFPNILEKSVKK